MIDEKNLSAISNEMIYRILMYAYEDIYDETLEQQEDFYDNLDDMMAEILMMATIRQLKRGLYKEYVRKTEPSIMVRGKIDINASIKLKTQQSQKLVCLFDAFDKDNLYNQIIKATCLYMLRQGRVTEKRRKRLRDLLLSFHEVSEIPLRAVTWENIRFHKDKFAYRSLIGLCYIIYKGITLTEDGEQTYLHPIVFSDLYERFIQHFYAREWKDIAQTFQGKYNTNNNNMKLKNILTVDMVLTYGNYRMIMNTHYFDNLFSAEVNMRKQDYLDEQLERLLGTIKRNAFNDQGTVEGFLFYPSLEPTYVKRYEMDGHIMYLGTVDLSGPFEELKGILMDFGEDIIARGAQE